MVRALERLVVLLLAVAAGACSGGGGGGGGGAPAGGPPPGTPPDDGGTEPFGLTERVRVRGLRFPVSELRPAGLRAVRAFPGLVFRRPLFLCAPPDGTDRIFVVEQDGRIHVFPNDPAAARTAVFLDIAGRVNREGNEEGLLGLAFHPDYARNGLFYVFYSVANPRGSRLSRFRAAAPDRADAASETVLLEFERPFRNHNGGMLAFGPDGKLYVSIGDGGGSNDPQNNAQNLGSLLGKLLRLDPAGGIPPDNPFAGRAGARGEIWAYGLRNPWRFSFDRSTGELWLADVGQNAVEEIDVIERGGNYGWRLFEGDRIATNPGGLPARNFRGPIHTYTHADGESITGGHVYRGARVPSLAGAYVYGDYAAGRIWALVRGGGGEVASNVEVASIPGPASFGEDEAGELYACSFDGGIYRFEERTAGEEPFPALLSETGLFTDTANLVAAPGLIEYDVNSPVWSDGAAKRRWLALPGLEAITFRPAGAWDFPAGTVIVQHFEIDVDRARTTEPLRRLETRVLVRHASGWGGYVYRWNQAQDDALLLGGAAVEEFTVRDPAAPGGRRAQEWHYPSRADCLRCHTAAAGRILGLTAAQLNRDFSYPAAADNQLRAWNHIGLFDRDIGEAGAYEALADPASASASLAARARAYLDANCAMCHRPGAPAPGDLDLRAETPPAEMGAVGVPPGEGGLGLDDPVIILPGRKERSVLWERLRRRDEARMPPLATSEVDALAVEVIGAWIDSLPE